MYCPNCSVEAQGNQKFCRSCGMGLRAVAQMVVAQSNPTKSKQCDGVGSFRGWQRGMIIWGAGIMLGAVALGSTIKVLSKDHIQIAGEFTPYLSAITLLICFLGMAMVCYPVLKGFARQRPDLILPDAQPTITLRPDRLAAEPSSITEKTTDFMEAKTVMATPPRSVSTTE